MTKECITVRKRSVYYATDDDGAQRHPSGEMWKYSQMLSGRAARPQRKD